MHGEWEMIGVAERRTVSNGFFKEKIRKAIQFVPLTQRIEKLWSKTQF